jgi:hypothetical protein
VDPIQTCYNEDGQCTTLGVNDQHQSVSDRCSPSDQSVLDVLLSTAYLCLFCLLLSPMVAFAAARSLRHKGTGQNRQIRTYDRLHCGFRVQLVTRFNREDQMTVPI